MAYHLSLRMKTFINLIIYLLSSAPFYVLSCGNVDRITHSAQSLKFLVIADWGGLPFFPYKTLVEMGVGRQMAFIAEKLKVDFVLALGDNFYLKGVESVDDLRFKETFETAFNYDSLNIPWYVVAGNHDHYGNVSAQIMYSSKSSRWNFPDFYYQMNFDLPSSNKSASFFMLDTVILCGNTEMLGNAQPHLKPAMKQRSTRHWNWLRKSLAASKADYKIVCGHYPVYSVGLHGSTDCLVDKLKPLLKKFSVDAYFSGHDHSIQHIQVKDKTFLMDYFVSGSANIIDPSLKHKDRLPPGSLLYHWADLFSLGAFTIVDIKPNNFTVSVMSANGKEMYSYSKNKDGA